MPSSLPSGRTMLVFKAQNMAPFFQGRPCVQVQSQQLQASTWSCNLLEGDGERIAWQQALLHEWNQSESMRTCHDCASSVDLMPLLFTVSFCKSRRWWISWMCQKNEQTRRPSPLASSSCTSNTFCTRGHVEEPHKSKMNQSEQTGPEYALLASVPLPSHK